MGDAVPCKISQAYELAHTDRKALSRWSLV